MAEMDYKVGTDNQTDSVLIGETPSKLVNFLLVVQTETV